MSIILNKPFRHACIAAFFLLAVSACSSQTEGVATTLRGAEIPFTGESVMGTISGEPYRFFRYETVEAALADKKIVSKDGKTVGNKSFLWEGPVHFYYYKDRLVIYVGENPEVIALIEKTFGPQFAGD